MIAYFNFCAGVLDEDKVGLRNGVIQVKSTYSSGRYLFNMEFDASRWYFGSKTSSCSLALTVSLTRCRDILAFDCSFCISVYYLLGRFTQIMASAAGLFDRDAFLNNLLSDLAPLLTLFGEQVTRQFLSSSLGWADHILLATSPLGIITIVVSVIRISGPGWLKAVIGRYVPSHLCPLMHAPATDSFSVALVM